MKQGMLRGEVNGFVFFFKARDLLAFAIQIRTENGDLGREERCMHAREELRKAQLVMAWLSRQETFSGHLT